MWLRVLSEWVPMGMGVTGATIPFIIGASHPNKSGAADIADLARVLYEFQGLESHRVRIEDCYVLGQPVASLYSLGETMAAGELIRRSRGGSALYVSEKYRGKGTI